MSGDDDEKRRPGLPPPTYAPPRRDERRQTGRRQEVVRVPPSVPPVPQAPRPVHLRPVDELTEEMRRVASQVVARAIEDLLEGLDRRIIDAVDERMKQWMTPVSERLDEIARQQGADVEARVRHAAWEAERLASERAEARIRAIEEAARAREAHYVGLSVQLTQREKTETEKEELPKGMVIERWKVYVAIGGTVVALLTALGAWTTHSRVQGSNR